METQTAPAAAVEAYVKKFTGRWASDEALAQFARDSFVGTYDNPEAWAVEEMASWDEEDLAGRTPTEFADDCSTESNGAVDFLPAGDGRTWVFIEP